MELLGKQESPEVTQVMLEVIHNGNEVAWQHINMIGEYDFSKLTNSIASRFDTGKILAC
jgi:hypothetical protein